MTTDQSAIILQTVERAPQWMRRDLEAKAPMRRDTIFRIASLTKPVTAAAALMLYDEGRARAHQFLLSPAPVPPKKIESFVGPAGRVRRCDRVGGQVDLDMRGGVGVIEQALEVVLDLADVTGGFARAHRDEEGLLLRQGQCGGRLVDGLLRGLAGFALPRPEHRKVAQRFGGFATGAGALRRCL